MRLTHCLLVASLVLLAPASSTAQEMFQRSVGKWKYNAAKSTTPGEAAAQSYLVTFTMTGPAQVNEAWEVIDHNGKLVRRQVTRTYDSKERPVPDRPGVMESCETIDARSVRCTMKQSGILTQELLVRMAEDGKRFTAQTTRLADNGEMTSRITVYDKQ